MAPDRLRFDFTHFSPLTPLEIENIENFMNDRIRDNDPVTATVMSYKDAMDIGAIALFGDKYEDKVRVLQVGNYSTELCGGTHLHSTGEIRLFKIISETAVASGVRRIEALTGDGALNYLKNRDQNLKEIETELRVTPREASKKIKQMTERTRELERQLGHFQEKTISENTKDLLNLVKEKNGIKILAIPLSVSNIGMLRSYCDQLRDRLKSGIIVLGAHLDNRAILIAAVTKDLTSRYSAHDIIQKLSPLIGGRGGGKPDLAQGGGPHIDKLLEALKKTFDVIS